MAKLDIRGAKVERIVRTNGKDEATMLVTIPANISADVPLGAVVLSVETLQANMFAKKGPIRGDEAAPGKGKVAGSKSGKSGKGFAGVH